MNALSAAELQRQMADQAWRLNNLYYITDKAGKLIPFKMNWAQEAVFESLWTLNLILKVRQLGLSTFINLLQLDTCVFNKNTSCGVIAQDLESAGELFRNNIQTPYQNLPEAVRQAVPVVREQAKHYVFGNGSSIRVATSLRGGTMQILHVSEFGKICAKHPERAREIVTGSFETVGQGNIIAVESTAEGREGYFYDYCREAKALQEAGKKLTPADWQFFFLPWWKHPDYIMDPEGVVITAERTKYFDELEVKIGRKLVAGRRAWYVKKAEKLGDDMLREYPSTSEEAFQVSIRGAYYADHLSKARKEGRITKVRHVPSVAVETWWDLGMNDAMSIWFVQQVGQELHVIDYYENSGEGLAHYAQVLQQKAADLGYVYGLHFAPHDIAVRELGTGTSRKETAATLGIRFETAPNLAVIDGIEAVRNILPLCWFDEERCDQGIKCLEHYRKEWDEQRGTYKDRPLHDWASHGSDAFRTGAIGRAKARGRNVPASDVEAPTAAGWT